MKRITLILTLFLFASIVHPGHGQTPQAIRQQIAMQQKLGETINLDLTFHDEDGKTKPLQTYFGDTPVILHLAYFRCPMLCNMTRDGLLGALGQLKLDPGKDFQIITLSFDPREGSVLAAEAHRLTTQRYGRQGAEDAWHFLTGNEEQIRELTDAVGFQFAWDKDRQQFAHGAGVIVLTPDGQVSRYLSGIDFSPRDLRLALVEASNHKIGSPTDQILLMCYQYDPAAGRYGFQITAALRIGGAMTILGLCVGVGWLIRREKTLEQHRTSPHGPARGQSS